MIDEAVLSDAATGNNETAVNDTRRFKLQALKNCSLLRCLPYGNTEKVFNRLRVIKVKKDETIIREGEKGDALYIIGAGMAEVWQKDIYGIDTHLIAELKAGDLFGSHALITGKLNTKTVHMTTDGTLLVLGKDDFNKLISKKMVKTISARLANIMLENGFKLLDVRYKEEYEEDRIPNAQWIPLFDLSQRINELDENEKYIVYCRCGNRSAIATMILGQNHIEAFSVNGGLRDWPYEKEQKI